MKEPSRDQRGGGGSAEALVVAGILGLAGVALLLLWSITRGFWAGFHAAGSPAAYWGFLLIATLVLVLDGAAAIGLRRRLARGNGTPDFRWIFVPGLVALVLAMGATVLMIRGSGLTHDLALLVPGLGPSSRALVLLLVLGGVGLLLAVAGLLSERTSRSVGSGGYGVAAVLLLGGGALLLAALQTGWVAPVSTRRGPLTPKLDAAQLWFGVLLAGALLTIVLAMATPKPGRIPVRLLQRLPIGTLLLLVLILVSESCIRAHSGGFPRWDWSLEFLGELFRPADQASLLPPGWGVFRGASLLLVAFYEVAFLLASRRHRSPDPRPAISLQWFGLAAAGVGILLVAGGLDEFAVKLLDDRGNTTPKDVRPCVEAGAVLSLVVPVFLVSHLLSSRQLAANGRPSITLRRIGLAALALGAFGLIWFYATLIWFLEPNWHLDGSFGWLRVGAGCQFWGAIAFLVRITVAGVLEFLGRAAPVGG